MRRLGIAARLAIVVVAYAVLFAIGPRLFPVDVPPLSQAEQQQALLGLLVNAIIDSVVLSAIAAHSRLSRVSLALVLAAVLYFVKTLTSQLEVMYFMTSVTPAMQRSLFLMTVPLVLVISPLIARLFGHGRIDGEATWRSPMMSRREWIAKVVLLSVVVYPLMFFTAGYFIAWQSETLRVFYGAPGPALGFVAHFTRMFTNEPLILPFEALRGALWLGCALVVLRTTRGPWWTGGLLVALLFALVQNDVLVLPSALMPSEVRLYHFVETASSNFAWAWAIAWLMHASHLRGWPRR